jgi:hypothetical protein
MALGPNLGRMLLRKTSASGNDGSAMLPPEIALAAGRHHITNFDADSARDAAPAPILAGSRLFKI